MDKLEGVVERITYYNDENGYTVMRLKPGKVRFGQVGKDGLYTVVGNLPELQPGESVRLTGNWSSHKEFGKQFQAETVEQLAPATIEGLKRYLGSGLIKGVGPVTAKRIVEHFGMDTLDVLETSPDQLLAVPGVGKHRIGLIQKAWIEQRAIKEVMLFLQSHKVSTSLAVKIYKMYGNESIQQVQTDPYRLARDVYGIGFKTADQIARNMGLPADSPERIAAGTTYALYTLNEDGHVYAPRALTIETAAGLLEVPAEACNAAIDRLARSGEVIVEPTKDNTGDEAVYLLPMYHSEIGVAKRMLTMLGASNSRLKQAKGIDWPAFFEKLQVEDKVTLTDQQQNAVKAALTNKVSVLTGGPGTGKTTTLRAVIRALESVKAKYELASPPGRASKRLSEATERPARTIHRLLSFKPQEGFLFGEGNPLNLDMLIVDEASMLDLVLFYNVLKAVTPEMHLLLVGDVDQLPSVGAGDVLRDIIRSGAVPVTRLDAIFRQAGGSLIIQNAHRINHGEMPDVRNLGEDFFLFGADEPEAIADLVIDVVQNRIPAKFGLHPVNDVQVLSPMYRGVVGVQNLNEKLQAALNPAGSAAERRIGGRTFRVGDKVMQTRNNYDKDVYNGDVGRIHSIDFEDQTLTVTIDERLIEYDWSDADELVHAFASSVHRSQGTEYPAVVIPMASQHYMMLQRNLLYTAITRAKRLVVLVGQRKAIFMAVKNDKVAQRFSALDARLGAMAVGIAR